MKNYPWPLLFLLLMAFAACKEDHNNPAPAELPAAIEGSWLLIKVEGGLSGGSQPITSKQELVFQNGEQKTLINGAQQSISPYQLVKDSTSAGSWELKTDGPIRSFITLENDTLCIMLDVYDRLYAYYIRE